MGAPIAGAGCSEPYLCFFYGIYDSVAPELCQLAIENITWEVQHGFQWKNFDTWKERRAEFNDF